MKNIGLEIKILRESKKMTGKDLAEKIGLSQSQMSRLEKGQRRIDAKILNRIADALEVKPSHFFGETDIEEQSLNLQNVNLEIGKIIRQRRRERHLTSEDLAKKVNKTKTYIQEIENGKAQLLTTELIKRICKILKIDPAIFFEVQRDTIEDLKKQVLRLSREHAESTLGNIDYQGIEVQTESAPRKAIPVFGAVGTDYPNEFSNEGMPIDEVHDYIFVSGLNSERAFALVCKGDSMLQPQAPSFAEGDTLVFNSNRTIEDRDFALVRIVGQKPVFRQIFFDPGQPIRLQPLNRIYPPIFLHREEILQWFKLVTHIVRF